MRLALTANQKAPDDVYTASVRAWDAAVVDCAKRGRADWPALLDAAEQRTLAAEREAERLRTGQTIEGDHVSADGLWRANVEPLIEAVRVARDAVNALGTEEALAGAGWDNNYIVALKAKREAIGALLAATAPDAARKEDGR